MRVVVVGGGAREHVLCLALAADPAVTQLVVTWTAARLRSLRQIER
ncbi:MAG TPA: hypothetical protein VMU51_01150 [Mycobacteriales bacterium]|nr:hypothetical protein [Mycobacteriales bacterium]